MILIFDLGNTRIKWWQIENGHVISGGIAEYDNELAFLETLSGVYERVLISSVRIAEFNDFFAQVAARHFSKAPEWATSQYKFKNLTNGYKDFSALGVDRWLGMIGVSSCHPANFILVSIGTAVTLDVVVDGIHLGGFIGPGKNAFLNALGQSTDGVQVKPNSGQGYSLATTTTAAVNHAFLCMLSGMLQKTEAEVEKVLPVFVTGGDGELIFRIRPNACFLPQLMLKGICAYFNEPLIEE